jgi:hypothetical protein
MGKVEGKRRKKRPPTTFGHKIIATIIVVGLYGLYCP